MQKSSYYDMVIFLHPLESIININSKLINYFNCNIYDLFLNNYCLEYYNILKKIYPNSYMVLEKNKEHIAIEELLFYRDSVAETNKRTKVYNAVETIIVVPVLTTKINNNTQLELKIRRGNKYVSGFTISGGIVNDDKAEFKIIVPSSAINIVSPSLNLSS